MAKEIQLLHPDKFSNIFLGLGGFHTEKIVLACCGKLLEAVGARDIFVQDEIYGPVVTDKILKGKDYVLSLEAMRNLAEAVNRVKFDIFMQNKADDVLFLKNLVHNLIDDQHNNGEQLLNNKSLEQRFRNKWNDIKHHLNDRLYREYCSFESNGEMESEIWKFWNMFTNQVIPVLINLTRSFREGNWLLHLQAIRQALPLFFNCHRINYCRWTPIYFEDCLNLVNKHPSLHQPFCDGNFVVHHTTRKGSGMPMDQALEKEYNKKPKDPVGIIGITRREESVAKWNLMRHERGAYVKFIDDVSDYTHSNEYSLHHEFSTTVTTNDHRDVETMAAYIAKSCDILKKGKLSNISTGAQLSDETNHFLLNCFDTGESIHQKYRKERLEERSVALFDTIKDPHKKCKNNKSEIVKPDLEKIKLGFL